MPKRVSSRDAKSRLEGLGRAFTTADAGVIGVAPWDLARLADDGAILRIAHGIYLPGGMVPDHRTPAAEAALRFPGAVICLRTAAELHGLTMEMRDEAFIGMPSSFRPKPATLGNDTDGKRAIRWVRWTPKSLETGIQKIHVHGVAVSVTSPARTVVDYFRYRGGSEGGGKRGLFGRDEILDVLDRHLAGRRDADEELMELAETFGVRSLIEPILDGRRALVTRTIGGGP